MDTSKFYNFQKNRSAMPIKIIIGSRGCGKTYSVLDYLEQNSSEDSKFLYIRRDGTEIDSCSTEYGNPFKKLNTDKGYDIGPFSISKFNGCGFGHIDSDGKVTEAIGYGVALSTFASMRSQDFSDVDRIFFEEFIPEKQKRRIKGEGPALLNLYETINRNRELFGEKPVEMIMCANGIDLANPILLELGATSIIAKMLANDQHKITIPDKMLYIELVDASQISELKEETVLYKLANDDFKEDALTTKFRTSDLEYVRKDVNTRSYKPEFSFGDYVFFLNSENVYVALSNVPCKLALKEREQLKLEMLFAPRYRILRASGKVFFDDYRTLALFDSLLGYEVV